jgi:putative superfamily III holin-X
MDNNPTTLETLLEKAENYTKTSIELAKLQLIDKSADVLSSLVSIIVISIVVGMFLMLTNIGLAFWLGEVLGNVHYGFFAVAGFYLVLAIIIGLFKDQLIKTPMSNSFITSLLKQKVR